MFQEVVINRDFPAHYLAKGDIAILNDYVPDISGKLECIIEVYSVSGEFVGVFALPADNIELLQESDQLSVRKLIEAKIQSTG